MNRPRLIKGLRIAWTVWWGIVCVLLVVIWVRSYWWKEFIKCYAPSQIIAVESYRGAICVSAVAQYAPPHWKTFVLSGREPIIETTLAPLSRSGSYPLRFLGVRWIRWKGVRGQKGFGIFVHFWLTVLLTSILSVGPWIHWSKRFNLKTILIATTLIAVVLGLVIYSMK